jgi:signal transduction histidine kinase
MIVRVLLQKIASAARDLLSVDLILLYPLSHAEAIFDQPVAVGDLLDDMSNLRLPHETENIIRQIGAKREPYYQSDALEDSQLTLLSAHSATVQHGPERTFTARQQIRSFAGVPLLAQGQLLGVIAVNYRTRHQFLDSDRQILALFGQMAASVIAGSQLQIQQERRRIELDLHDGVKSSLRGLISLSRGASNLLTTDSEKAADYLHEIRRAAWGILSDINMVIHNLTPGGSPPESLREYINRDIQQLMSDPSIKLDVQIDPTLPPLPHHLTRVLLFILREAIANVYEHSKAKTASVRMSTGAGGLTMEICNDGDPFNPDTIDRSKHQGLMNMEQRAQQVGGSFTVRSGADGTHITVHLPREEERDGWPGR